MNQQTGSEAALKYRLDLEEVVTEILTGFIGRKSEEVDPELERALGDIGRFTGSDRTFIFTFREGQTLMDCTHEWCADGIEPRAPNLAAVPVEDFPSVANGIFQGRTVLMPKLSDYPLGPGPEMDELVARGSKSLLIVPMICGGAILGLLGLETVGGEASWPKEIVGLIRKAGEAFASSIKRKWDEEAQLRQAKEDLKLSEHKYRELVENANSIILKLDTEGRVTFFNEFAQEFFGYKEDEIIGRSAVGTIVPEVETGGRDLALMIREIGQHPERFARNENENMRKGGERVWISWTNKPIFNPEGRLLGSLCVGNDITELIGMGRELVRAKEAAEAADRLKSAFLASMSHELRTPLNSILGFTSILLQGIPGPLNGEQEKQLGMVQHSARHLLDLITDVLDISKIEAGQIDVASKPFDLRRSILQTVDSVLPLAQKKGIHIGVEIDGSIGTISGDRRRVEQVILNLLNNAVKFTGSGRVSIVARSEWEKAAISVSDTGIGIREEYLDKIFIPFFQVDNGLTRVHEGTGLGLSISRRLAEKMGGILSVESIYGEGSTFTLTLPAI